MKGESGVKGTWQFSNCLQLWPLHLARASRLACGLTVTGAIMVPTLSEHDSLSAPRMTSFGLPSQLLFEFQNILFFTTKLALSAKVLDKPNS